MVDQKLCKITPIVIVLLPEDIVFFGVFCKHILLGGEHIIIVVLVGVVVARVSGDFVWRPPPFHRFISQAIAKREARFSGVSCQF